MFGVNEDLVLVAASGARVVSDGERFEEEGSSLSFEDFYFVNGGFAGYIMRSPSGRKYSVKVGDAPFVDVDTHIDAEKALLSML